MGNKAVRQKLEVSDYVFEIDSHDIIDCTVEYSFTNLEVTCYDTEVRKNQKIPILCLRVGGNDIESGNDAWISFELDFDLDHFNELPEHEVIYITSNLRDSESFIKCPSEDNSKSLYFYFPTGTEDDIYRNLSNVSVLKEKENVFFFKVCVPSERIFTYFKVDFNKR